MTRFRVAAVLAAVVVGVAAAGGYLLGSSDAPTVGDATRELNRSYAQAMRSAYAPAFQSARVRGDKAGREKGGKIGSDEGSAAGSTTGGERAQAELDLIAAEQARLAAEAEAAERQANCGHPLFIDGACPTDAEVQYEEDAETYCGGGDYETAAALGIRC